MLIHTYCYSSKIQEVTRHLTCSLGGEPRNSYSMLEWDLLESSYFEVYGDGSVPLRWREIGCEDGSWVELAQDHVEW
jgi:hypothetical protein